MTTSSDDTASIFKRYRIPIGVGGLLVVALGLMLMQGSGEDARRSPDAQASVPPVPTTEVEVVENEVIEQGEVDYDTSLDLTTAVAAGR